LPETAGQGAGRGDGGGDVLDAGVDVEGVEQFEGPLPFGLRLVGDVDAGLDPPEQVGADGEKPWAARPSQMSRITALTPKISWITTTAGGGRLAGRAT
jgi:hypothetical protein